VNLFRHDTWSNANNRQAELSKVLNDVVVVVSERLHTAGRPLLDGDVVVHHPVDVGAGVAAGIKSNCLGIVKWIDKVMTHSKIVSQFVRQDLVIGLL
jgi:hypothetical protein